MLHVTNGDAVAQPLAVRLDGAVLPWRDVLHEGPVPGGLSLTELSAHRARYLAGLPWAAAYDDVLAELEQRDAELKKFKLHDEVVLWFEHDLYDQLQLLQLLSWFSLRDPGSTRLSLLCINAYPGVEPFHGLGQLDATQLAGLFPQRRPIGADELALGRRGWEAFTADTPEPLQQLIESDCSALEFLRPALVRLLEQYPSTRDGLSRSERQVLETLGAGPAGLGELFRRSQYDCEDSPFMGDTTFVAQLSQLAAGDRPLVRMEDDGVVFEPENDPAGPAWWKRAVRITEEGGKVLAGRVDRTHYRSFDRWIGGVHLHGAAEWRWGHRTGRIERQR